MAATGAQGWGINQYQTGLRKASARSFSFTLHPSFSLYLHLLIGGRSCLTESQSLSFFLDTPPMRLWRRPLLQFIGETMRGNVSFSTSVYVLVLWLREDRKVNTTLFCWSMSRFSAPEGVLRSYDSSVVVSFSVWVTSAFLLLLSTFGFTLHRSN